MSGSVRTGRRGRAHYRPAWIPVDVKLWAVTLALVVPLNVAVYLLARAAVT